MNVVRVLLILAGLFALIAFCSYLVAALASIMRVIS